ncbi:DUF3223 domain-containing protein [Streptomyces alanosinicus]|uniref:DUF3223 domain-containing protein n=1 Tax=Streptomyces alanosinicus TaxID=68171 RepID=A0A918MI25_9ACTN|nr:DUF3223 domain-containing protein [Streptomyces alanosinicus]GGW23342.1 hypothetical protein GCM10010339_93260 [Streptomyces alanosinicus]
MARGVMVGNTHYQSKEAVRNACRSIVAAYGIGSEVTGTHDDTFLRNLVALHPEYELKRGAGIAGFRVVRTEYGTTGFVVVRIDGTVNDFSWNACLTHPSHRSQVLAALRSSIGPQIAETRSALLQAGSPLLCAVTGSLIPPGELHVDHYDPTFLELAEQFISENEGIEAFRIKPDSGEGISGLELEDLALEVAWRDFHQRNAQLRPVLKRVNLSDLVKGRSGS